MYYLKLKAAGISVALCLLMVVICSSVNPGFKARITERALDYASQQAINSLASTLPSSNIPDQSGSSGDLRYFLTNIHITSFTKPDTSIRMVPGDGLTWLVSKAGINLSANWRIKYQKGWFKISTSGSVDASMRAVDATVTFALGADDNGRPSVASKGCSSSIGSVNIDIHGDISFILNLFKGQVEKVIQRIIPGKLCDALNTLINNNAEKQLQQIKVVTDLLHGYFQLDYRLMTAPLLQAKYMETSHKGEITWKANPHSVPFSPEPFPQTEASSSMLYLWISEYLPHTFAYSAQENEYFQYNLTASKLPPENRTLLNTTCTGICIGSLIPSIAQKYPDSIVEMHFNSTSIPLVAMRQDLLQVGFNGDIAMYANTPDGQVPYLLTLNVSATFNLSASIVNEVLICRITGSSLEIHVLKSAVGYVNDKVINTMAGLALKLFVIPELNEDLELCRTEMVKVNLLKKIPHFIDKGSKGFPLPVTENIKFINSQLHFLQGALMIETDVQYLKH